MSQGARFAGQVAIVTGAARGIGAAIAGRIAAEGATVVLVDREAAVDATGEALADAGHRAEALIADVTDARAVEGLVDAVAARHGRIDVLVNNAGITRDDLLFRLGEEDWDTVIEVNLKSAAKAGIRGLTSTLALELGPFGIRANAVAPGFIATEMTDATARRLGLDPEQHRAEAAAATPLRRVGTPPDVAAVVAFLASDDAAYVSGQTIEINGGAR